MSRAPAAALSLLLLSPAAHASGVAQQPHVRVELLSSAEALAPGEPFTLGLRFEIEKDWHLYWKNPGDSGMEPAVRWRLPEGTELGPILWPAPKLIRLKHLASYGYEEELILLTEGVLAQGATAGEPAELAVTLAWLVCKEDCLPGEARLELSLPVAETGRVNEERLRLLSAARERLPIAASDAGWTARARLEPVGMHVELSPQAGTPTPSTAMLFPEVPGWVHAAGVQRSAVREGRLHLFVPLQDDPDRDPPERLGAVLVSQEGWRGAGSEEALALEAAWTEELATFASVAGRSEGIGLWLAALLAFAGGILLNLMPCVLPVVSLKVLAFARVAGDRRAAILHAAVFSLGVIATFWAVAAVLLVLRGVGAQLGWGFQLQSPVVVAVLAALFTLLALNLFGLFEFGVPLAGAGGGLVLKRDFAAAFGSGVLATVVATPCTAPFMGGAVGAALAGPWWLAAVVFTALGAGMASPYLLLAACPPLLARIPKPGRWMESLRQALGFLLLGTVAWLVWVYGRLTDAQGEMIGVDGLVLLLAGLLLVGFGAWLLGRFGMPSVPTLRRRLLRTAAALAVAAGLLLPVRAVTAEAERLAWKAWSPELVEALEAEGRPYFLDFTASWCLSCQVNEQVALDRADVRAAFERHGITAIKADWTNRDEGITSALAALGRASVPVYVLHGGVGQQPRLLPNILTATLVLDAVEDAMRQAR